MEENHKRQWRILEEPLPPPDLKAGEEGYTDRSGDFRGIHSPLTVTLQGGGSPHPLLNLSSPPLTEPSWSQKTRWPSDAGQPSRYKHSVEERRVDSSSKLKMLTRPYNFPQLKILKESAYNAKACGYFYLVMLVFELLYTPLLSGFIVSPVALFSLKFQSHSGIFPKCKWDHVIALHEIFQQFSIFPG